MNNENFITFAQQSIGKEVTVSVNVPFEIDGVRTRHFLFEKGDRYLFKGFVLTDDEQSVIIRSAHGIEELLSFKKYTKYFGLSRQAAVDA
jgi:hypothetical protein